MQTISPELEALLKSRLQVGSGGFRGRIEIDRLVNPSEAELLAPAFDPTQPVFAAHTWFDGNLHTWKTVNSGDEQVIAFTGVVILDQLRVHWHYGGAFDPTGAPAAVSGAAGPIAFDVGDTIAGPWTEFLVDADPVTNAGVTYPEDFDLVYDLGAAIAGRFFRVRSTAAPGVANNDIYEIQGYLTAVGFVSLAVPVSTISIDKSLNLATDQLEAVAPNEDLGILWGEDLQILTGGEIRAWQWYGDPADEVRAFTGLVDTVVNARDPLSVAISARDRMSILIEDTFSATAPQGLDEDGAVRTAANGVYEDIEVSDLVLDLLERAGYPSADIDVAETSYALREYVIADGTTRAETIAELAGLVGYSAWADELGVFHFAPTFTAGAVLEPDDPAYTFRAGEDLTSLSDSVDQLDLRTRVKARGPLTSLKDAWNELWRTRKIKTPLDVWWDPSADGSIRVLDKSTKRLYKVRQSDRKVLSSVNLGAVIPYPATVSGNPANVDKYWVASLPWRYGGSTSGNKLYKLRKSDNKVLAKYSLPAGEIRALKVSEDYVWFTRVDTDRLYQRRRSDASAIDSWTVDYWNHDAGVGPTVQQLNPKAIMVDGSTLWVFWTNGDTIGRWLLSEEATPDVITNAVYMSGTRLHGTEIDTATHEHCWGIHQQNGVVAKFRLDSPFDETVYAEVVDTELEDELGLLAGAAARTHDTHPLDAAHPYLVRRDTLDLPAVNSLAQATETATRRLELLSRRRRVLDAGILGNPALQKTDIVRVEDPVTGIARRFTIDTYRSAMGTTYLGTLALVPVDDADDEVIEETDPVDDVAIELVGTTTAVSSGAATSVMIPVPAGVEDGDLLLARVFKDDTAGVQAVTLAGWTQIGADSEHAWFWRIAASEPASYAPSVAAARNLAAVMTAWRGAHATTPIAGYAFTSGIASGTAPASPAVTLATADVVRVVAVETDRGAETITEPADFEVLPGVDTGGTASTDLAGALAFAQYSGANPPAATWTLSPAAASRTDQVVLVPA